MPVWNRTEKEEVVTVLIIIIIIKVVTIARAETLVTVVILVTIVTKVVPDIIIGTTLIINEIAPVSRAAAAEVPNRWTSPATRP